MQATITTFSVPKAGSSQAEYEDASSISAVLNAQDSFSGPHLTAAVADGASEAMLAGRWAHQLVTGFTRAPVNQALSTTILEAAAGWDDVEASYRKLREEAEDPIAWYEEDGLHHGSYATILGVQLLDSAIETEGPLLAQALGDACLFQVREGIVITKFPIDDPAAFGTSPSLAPSRPASPAKISDHCLSTETTWQLGDCLYLVTDALAYWFLAQSAAGGTPWQTLWDLGTEDQIADFAGLINGCRANGSIKNDDTTLLRIDLM